jgi:hypothetical protein
VSTGNRDLEKEKSWLEIIDRQKRSGKSISQFCKDEGIVDSRFYYWQSALAKRKKGKRQTKLPENKVDIPFVPLVMPDSVDFNSRQNSAGEIEISKIVLRISAGTDKSTLACILQSLEKA